MIKLGYPFLSGFFVVDIFRLSVYAENRLNPANGDPNFLGILYRFQCLDIQEIL